MSVKKWMHWIQWAIALLSRVKELVGLAKPENKDKEQAEKTEEPTTTKE
jgi:hypothetical protein